MELSQFLTELSKTGRLELLSEGTLIRYTPKSALKRKEEEEPSVRFELPYQPLKARPASDELLDGLREYFEDSYDPAGNFNAICQEAPELYQDLVRYIQEHAERGYILDRRERRMHPVTRLVLGHFLPEDWNPSYMRLIKLSEAYGIELNDLVRGYETGIFIYRDNEFYTGRVCTKPELRAYLVEAGIKPNRFLRSSSMADYRTLLMYAEALGCLGVAELLDRAMGLMETFIMSSFVSGPGAAALYQKRKAEECLC